ncbi:MAG: HAD family phosphatase [Bacteroidales bacterium]|nr:HAD family phosphatase [Bacteroidales bacterium]
MKENSIRNIIFDFGGVICNIDISITEKAFVDLGIRQFDKEYSVTERDNFFGMFETGKITPQQFRDTLKHYFDRPVSDRQLDDAWNALLQEIPASRIALLRNLSKRYRLFLLSNTNEIHYTKYLKELQEVYSVSGFEDLFEKAYFSHQIGLRKPFREVFDFVVTDAGVNRSETLFIDDSIQHVEGAKKAGLLAYHLLEGEEITDLFSPEMQFLRPLQPSLHPRG